MLCSVMELSMVSFEFSNCNTGERSKPDNILEQLQQNFRSQYAARIEKWPQINLEVAVFDLRLA